MYGFHMSVEGRFLTNRGGAFTTGITYITVFLLLENQIVNTDIHRLHINIFIEYK